MNKRRAGQLGGLQTYLRYGSEGMIERGEKGGRPKLPKLEQLRQQSASAVQNEERGGRLPNGTNLKELKRLWKQRWGGLEAVTSSPQGGRDA